MMGLIVILSAAAVIVALAVTCRRLGDLIRTNDDLYEQRSIQPTRDELHRWLFDLQDAVTNGLKEARSASVQLRHTTEALVRRIEQVERINETSTIRIGRPSTGDHLDPRRFQ